MLTVNGVSRRFGGLTALADCSLTLEAGKITGLIGPNGAGKTTLFNIVAGNLKPSSGQVMLGREDVTGRAPHELYERGLVRTFQIAHEFARMTVRENLLASAARQRGEHLFDVFFRSRQIAEQEAELGVKADEVMDFLDLTRLAAEPAGILSGGQKKLLELGRTMMTDPKIVLLDEIGAGVNRTLLKRIAELIRQLNRRGTTFFLIEHDMDFVAEICDPVIVMVAGRVLMQGQIEDIRRDSRVIDAYFGGGDTAAPVTATSAA